MPIVYVSIGNSDDKLTQNEWAHFAATVDQAIRRFSHRIHGAWTSESVAPWQNACWCVETDSATEDLLRERLAETAKIFRQDSIAWAPVAKTEFIKATT